MYQALYRKYRPKTFDDVCGQKSITTTLQNEVQTGKTSHAYLFTGLRGSGKTTCSKIIAKAINCLQPVNGNPCCICEICRGIDNDSITDVMEIDAASNSGVDYMRELREQAFYQPVQCKKRVYIIDETHMLSAEAFNALLKIMEEPPHHVLFILATTEAHKVPATIVSRCQRFDFKHIEAQDIADRLQHIAGCEGFSLERDAALMIARLADGGMRDAISLLDQCASHTAQVDLAVVAQCAGISGSDALFTLSAAAAQNDCTAAMLALGDICHASADMQRLCEQLTGHFRNLLVARCAQKTQELIVCLPQELELYQSTAVLFSVERLLYILNVLQDTYVRMGRSPNKRIELEMAFVRICVLQPTVATSVKETAIPVHAPALTAKIPPEMSAVSSVEPDASAKTAVPFTPWADVLSRLKDKNHPLHGALADSRAYHVDDLILIQSKNELFLKMIRENEYARANLHECIIEVTGKKHRLGPYREKQYRLEETKPDLLEQVLQTASRLGVDMDITE